jgi:hypothetical protein
MESFLICSNSKCRYLINLREGAQVLERSKLVLDECPECGHPWSSYCLFCRRPLDVNWKGDIPHCKHCGGELKARTT